MRFLKPLLGFCFIIPIISFANDIVVHNSSTSPVTASTNVLCSSAAGDAGIAMPNSTMVLPQEIINTYCRKTCEVQVFASKSCSSPKIAVAGIDPKQGVLWIKNLNVDNYKVSGSGYSVLVEGGKKSWYQFWK